MATASGSTCQEGERGECDDGGGDDNRDSAQETTSGNASQKKPVCLIVLGMAGSGKTTFVQRLNAHLHTKKSPPYVINLDPAVHEVPFPANIDIRDTVNYKEVMKQYGLGPNGGIVTSLNLFATRFDQVMKFIEKKQYNHQYVLIDTPGQIEVFTWSASGTIITETLASSFPCVVVYVMDTSRSVNPVTFMSNMLYACRSDTEGMHTSENYGLDEFFVQVAEAAKEYETDYRPEYERLHKELADAQSRKQQEQMEHLRKDMGAVAMETTSRTEEADVAGRSDLIFNRGNPDEDEEEEGEDSDTDDIDHSVTEESKEGTAFGNFLKERKEVVQVRNRKSQ
uniref:GPN-loop GTPase n=1 Tax=Oncorhynchus mykiss TaxID=8022 RepID=A0A8C7U9Z1_ONCMY